MTTDISGPDALDDPARREAAASSGHCLLRRIVIAAGLGCSLLFVVVGLGYGLQMYGDGSIFSYSVAVQDAWAFHWHNISGRLTVYMLCYLPAEAYVELTGDARGGIVVYGLLFFAAPLTGLIATLAADRSNGRIIFTFACLSTACLCPLVFGAPTEMWMAHAWFWPALAVCHYARRGPGMIALIFAIMLALALTHEGAMIFALAILATLGLRGLRDPAFVRAAGVFLVVVAIWIAVKATFRPDDYIAPVLATAAFKFIDVTSLGCSLGLLVFATLAGYAAAVLLVRRLNPAIAHGCAVAIVAAALAVYWLGFDHALHTDDRYVLRTALLIATPVLGALAALSVLDAEDRLDPPIALPPRLTTALARSIAPRAAAGAILLVLLVHAVETAKFVTAWTDYKSAVQTLATGTASDPALGDARFVSSDRIAPGLNRLSWSSTTVFLSVLAAPDFIPARLVVDPHANYFWLSCRTATANAEANRALPTEGRRLLRVYACLHR
jgi:hypothetical protein